MAYLKGTQSPCGNIYNFLYTCHHRVTLTSYVGDKGLFAALKGSKKGIVFLSLGVKLRQIHYSCGYTGSTGREGLPYHCAALFKLRGTQLTCSKAL